MKISIPIVVLYVLLPVLGHAHNGVDHSAPAAPSAPTAAGSGSPIVRFVTQSPDFEVVGEVHDAHLTLWLDRYATNAPVNGATIDIEGDGIKLALSAQGDGIYSASLPKLLPGKYALILSIQAGESSDLLTADIQILPTQLVASAPAGKWVLGGLFLLSGFGLWFGWKRRPLHYFGLPGKAA